MYNMSIDEKKQWSKHAFEIKLKNIYYIKRQNGMTCIHENNINKMSEFNLIHDILNPSKFTRIFNSYYSPILKGCMNTRKVR